MTDSTYTHITLVSDRSGSMDFIRADAEGAINTFVKDQKKEPGRATFTLVQFDTQVETVFDHVDLQSVGHYRLVPRGSTALRDAWGTAVVSTGEWLAGLPEDERPGNVVVAIVTDGHENASHEWTEAQIKELTERQQNDYGWSFVFLAANQDAVAQGLKYGLDRDHTLTFAATGAGATNAYASVSASVSGLRSSGIYKGFSDEDRKNAEAQQ